MLTLPGACVWYGAYKTRRFIAICFRVSARRAYSALTYVLWASDFGKHNPASEQNVGPCRIPRRITILLGTPCSKKITSKRCWAAKRSGYLKTGRSRWPRACSCRTSYGDALAVALTQTCVHFLNNVCAWQIGFTRSWLFPVGIFSQIGSCNGIL